jgi:uncharacterized UBP type Zn finger protein
MTTASAERCEHFAGLAPAAPRSRGCEECLEIGATWTELRVCQTCGHVGCCEDSKHAHALRHFKETGHPVIAPLDDERPWTWCYAHRRYYDPMPGAGATRGRSRLASLLGRLVGRS